MVIVICNENYKSSISPFLFRFLAFTLLPLAVVTDVLFCHFPFIKTRFAPYLQKRLDPLAFHLSV